MNMHSTSLSFFLLTHGSIGSSQHNFPAAIVRCFPVYIRTKDKGKKAEIAAFPKRLGSA